MTLYGYGRVIDEKETFEENYIEKGSLYLVFTDSKEAREIVTDILHKTKFLNKKNECTEHI
jgi:hypothetical protein